MLPTGAISHSQAYRNGGRCAWCRCTPEMVMDRRAPLFCTGRPADLPMKDEAADARNDLSGY